MPIHCRHWISTKRMEIKCSSDFIKYENLRTRVDRADVLYHWIHTNRKIVRINYSSIDDSQDLFRDDSVTVECIVVMAILIKAAVRRTECAILTLLFHQQLSTRIKWIRCRGKAICLIASEYINHRKISALKCLSYLAQTQGVCREISETVHSESSEPRASDLGLQRYEIKRG
jgi:hypothetical protein